MPDAALQGGCRYCGEVIDPNMQAHAIINEVAAEHRVPVEDLYGSSRAAPLVAARACAIRRIHTETALKQSDIADLVGLERSTIAYHLSANGARAAAPSGGERV